MAEAEAEAEADLSSGSRPDPDALPLLPFEPTPPKPDRVEDVFDHWRRVMRSPRSKLDPKRRSLIARAIKLYSVEDCITAIDGCAASDFHMGREPGKPALHNSIELIFRSADKIDAFIARAPQRPEAKALSVVRPTSEPTDDAIERAKARLLAQKTGTGGA